MPSPVRAFCSTQGAGAVCHRRQFMPVLEIHLIAGHHDDAAISALLSEASVLFVDILYSDMEPRPIGRARALDRKSTRELQSLMRISYAVFCLKKKNTFKS